MSFILYVHTKKPGNMAGFVCRKFGFEVSTAKSDALRWKTRTGAEKAAAKRSDWYLGDCRFEIMEAES